MKYKRYNSTKDALNMVNSKTVSRNCHPMVTHKVCEIFRQSMASLKYNHKTPPGVYIIITNYYPQQLYIMNSGSIRVGAT